MKQKMVVAKPGNCNNTVNVQRLVNTPNPLGLVDEPLIIIKGVQYTPVYGNDNVMFLTNSDLALFREAFTD